MSDINERWRQDYNTETHRSRQTPATWTTGRAVAMCAVCQGTGWVHDGPCATPEHTSCGCSQSGCPACTAPGMCGGSGLAPTASSTPAPETER